MVQIIAAETEILSLYVCVNSEASYWKGVPIFTN